MNKISPIYKLFDYACDKFYCIECDYKIIKGLLLNYGSPMVVLAEEGIYHIEQRDIRHMRPISIPTTVSEEYRNLIETYLSECAAQS